MYAMITYPDLASVNVMLEHSILFLLQDSLELIEHVTLQRHCSSNLCQLVAGKINKQWSSTLAGAGKDVGCISYSGCTQK